MGVIKRGILGGFQNKVGNVVGTSWKGIDVMKALPVSVANPRTSLQVNQRTKFRAVVELASLLLISFVKPLWDRFAQRQSGFNAFCSSNIDAFANNGDLTFNQLVLSKGVLSGLDNLTVSNIDVGDETAFATWDLGLGSNGSLSDLVYAVIIDSEKNIIGSSSGSVARSIGEVTFELNRPVILSETLHFYFAVRSADGFRVSNTQYVAKTEVE